MSEVKVIREGLRPIVRPNTLPNVLNIGLTGTIGAGKTTLARALQAQGAAIVDMDAIARAITAPDGAAMDSIRHAFGVQMIQDDGSLNRTKMRQLVFNDVQAKVRLEGITHPLIYRESVNQAHAVAQQTPQPICIVYDIPLLVGNKLWLDMLDSIVVVVCERHIQIQRVLQRNPDYTLAMIEAVLDNQASSIQLLEIASVVVDNSQIVINHLQDCTQVNILLEYIKNLNSLKINLNKII